MKKIIYVFLTGILLVSVSSKAYADATYAVLDNNGNVTNIIVCGSACSSGEFAGNKVVPQVAPDPVTNENRGGFWMGPNTTTYNFEDKSFTMLEKVEIINSIVEVENNSTTELSATIDGHFSTSFKYEDTIGSNLFTRSGFKYGLSDNSKATISINKDGNAEFLFLGNRKTADETSQYIKDSGLVLLNSRVQTFISLLSVWIK